MNCKYSVLSLPTQSERVAVNPVRGVVDLNKISISTFVDTRDFPARVARGLRPSLFYLFPHEDLVCADFAVAAFFAGEGCKIIFALFDSFLDSIY